MENLKEKDKKIREKLKSKEQQHFVLKAILRNLNFLTLIRFNAFQKLNNNSHKKSKASISNRCIMTINRKRLNKWTSFSRHIYLKCLRSGLIPGTQKSSW